MLPLWRPGFIGGNELMLGAAIMKRIRVERGFLDLGVGDRWTRLGR